MVEKQTMNGKRWPGITATVLFGLLLISSTTAAVVLDVDIFEFIGILIFVTVPLAVLSAIFSIVTLCIGRWRIWAVIMLLCLLLYACTLLWLYALN